MVQERVTSASCDDGNGPSNQSRGSLGQPKDMNLSRLCTAELVSQVSWWCADEVL
jgi:hypothetical protein